MQVFGNLPSEDAADGLDVPGTLFKQFSVMFGQYIVNYSVVNKKIN